VLRKKNSVRTHLPEDGVSRHRNASERKLWCDFVYTV